VLGGPGEYRGVARGRDLREAEGVVVGELDEGVGLGPDEAEQQVRGDRGLDPLLGGVGPAPGDLHERDRGQRQEAGARHLGGHVARAGRRDEERDPRREAEDEER
jgi:hypothetical protein